MEGGKSLNFNSISFFVFFAIVFFAYRAIPFKYGRILLVVASYVFYGLATPWYVILLLASTITDFIVALQLSKTQDKHKRKMLLAASIVVNLGLLSFFKYSDFFIANVNVLSSLMGWDEIAFLNLLLPVGISFYTFQTLAYSIDVYRREMEPERDFLTFSLYVGFFPQLVAGPIERAKDLIPQLKQKVNVSIADLQHGLERILWGLIKKMVFADRLAVVVANTYNNAPEASNQELFIATFAFAFQLYLDFSGYTDIAIGLGRLLGVKLSENFNYPYLSLSQASHWRKWHRTLTLWFRDYVFRAYTDNGKRKSAFWQVSGVLLVFSLTGFWHGANWNMVAFGFVAGVFLIAQRLLEPVSKKVRKQVKRLSSRLFNYVYQPLIIGWNFTLWMALGPFFLLRDIDVSLGIYKSFITSSWITPPSEGYYAYAVFAGLLYVLHAIRGQYIPKMRTGELSLSYNRWITNTLLVLMLIYGAYDYKETFIYFQF